MKKFAVPLFLLSFPAWGQVNCIPMTVVTPYATGAIQSIGYNTDTLNLVASYRAPPITVRAFQNVPKQIAQRFVGMTSADAFFNASVAPYYHEALLTTADSSMCPIQSEGGSWLLTH